MRLSGRDLAATLVLGIGIAFGLSVTQGWNWPLMNGVRAGIVAVGVAGLATCSVSGWAGRTPSFWSPFVVIAAIVGVIALGVGIAGLVAGTMPYLVLLMAAVVLLWIITTLHRLVAGQSVIVPAGLHRRQGGLS